MAYGVGLAGVGELGHGDSGDSYSTGVGGNITLLLLISLHYTAGYTAYRGGKSLAGLH